MDTPEKTHISSSLSKFEDSPVFNYINNLSPIKPHKSIHFTQTFNFTSLPSIFTSPHVNSHKDSRFLKRHSYTDPSKPELSSADGTKGSTSEEAGADVQGNFDPDVSLDEASFELSQTLKYDCGIPPNSNPTPVIETSCVLHSTCTSTTTVSIEHKEETIGCEWEDLISDTSDLLIFNSPNDSGAFRCPTLISQFPQDDINKACQTTVGSDEYRDPTEGTGELNENFEDASLTNIISGNPSDYAETRMSAPDSFKPGSNLHRGFRRRCLDFEVLAARRKNLDGGSNTNSFVDNKLVPGKPASDSSGCIVPGIGLHLNALAIASRDNKNTKLETLSSGTQKLSFSGSTKTDIPPTAGQEIALESLASASSERETDATENGLQRAEDASQASAYLVNEEFNQYSPKKKRRRSEQAGESEACKRCNCKKSKCLKLYCECFAAGVYCIEPCSCQDCFNKPIHEDIVLATRKQIESRNPLAFAPKVISSIPEVGDDLITTPASARHKRGCNCKKSNCLKKYCECFQGGVGCSVNCRCEGCKNAFGRKDGSAILETEGEREEEEETDPSALPTTPLQPLVQLPFSSKSKPPRSFSIGSSSVYTGLRYGKPDIIRPQNVIEKHFQTVAEDETHEILRADSSPGTDIKTSSPNSKRITPTQCELGSTPGGGRGVRRLILQSIPSFPSLTPKH